MKIGETENFLNEHSLLNFLRSKGIDVETDPIILPNGNKMPRETALRGIYSALGDSNQSKIRPFVGAKEIKPGQSIQYMTDGLADVEEAVQKMAALAQNTKSELLAEAFLKLVAKFDNKKDDKAVLAKKFGRAPQAQSDVVAA